VYVNVGELNKRIKIISEGVTADSDGYVVPNRVTVWECWAKATRTSGTEMIKGNADFSQTKMRFLIRYTDKKIDREMIVEYQGEDYEIEYVNDYEDNHQFIEIIATKLDVK